MAHLIPNYHHKKFQEKSKWHQVRKTFLFKASKGFFRVSQKKGRSWPFSLKEKALKSRNFFKAAMVILQLLKLPKKRLKTSKNKCLYSDEISRLCRNATFNMFILEDKGLSDEFISQSVYDLLSPLNSFHPHILNTQRKLLFFGN